MFAARPYSAAQQTLASMYALPPGAYQALGSNLSATSGLLRQFLVPSGLPLAPLAPAPATGGGGGAVTASTNNEKKREVQKGDGVVAI